MAGEPQWLSVEGGNIANEDGEAVLLKGYCLGGWLNTENFINGYPFVDHLFFAALRETLGDDLAASYYECQYDHYLREADVAFLSECGTNSVRLPFNYRLFESDASPGAYDGPGWTYFDRIIGWCRRHGLYVMLDLHAAQGWQNPDWHCDNPANVCLLWGDQGYRDRVAGLWCAIAERYADEPVIAGYEILNEPTAPDTDTLQGFYEEVVPQIRRVDDRHIIFLEGNMWGTEFDGLRPFADDLVYACHIYTGGDFDFTPYPHEDANPDTIAAQYRHFVEFGREHGVPMWCSEFGAHHYTGDRAVREGRLRCIDDQISHFESVGHSWSMWTYKDVGVMGIATLADDSPYMRRTAPVRELKARLGADMWTGGRDEAQEELLRQLIDEVQRAGGDRLTRGAAAETIRRSYRDAVGNLLVKPFAEQFQGMNADEIDRMMQSWRLENCNTNQGLMDILRSHSA
ncbi:MAG: cellulase family glycosylhydrolase [Candidatus Brocadiaceae bacterium]